MNIDYGLIDFNCRLIYWLVIYLMIINILVKIDNLCTFWLTDKILIFKKKFVDWLNNDKVTDWKMINFWLIGWVHEKKWMTLMGGIDGLIDRLMDWLIDKLIDWLIYLLIDLLTDWLIYWLINWSIDGPIDQLMDWLVDGLIELLIEWLIC